MKRDLTVARMAALAFLYDRMREFPDWLTKLSPHQVEDVADLMVRWHLPPESNRIISMEDIERREVLRAILICEGDVLKAAKALNMGKTTIYRKLRQWGHIFRRQILLAQASVLRCPTNLLAQEASNSLGTAESSDAFRHSALRRKNSH